MALDVYNDRMNLLKQVLFCFDQQRLFGDVREQINQETGGSISQIFRFALEIDVTQVLEHNASLGSQMLLSPQFAASLFQEVIFEFCESHDLLPKESTLAQISVRLRLVHVPTTSRLLVTTVCDLHKLSGYSGYVKVTGIVTGISATAKYTQSTKYTCPDTDCEGHTGNHYIRIHVPGASEANTVRSDFRCNFCACNLEEVKSQRVLADKCMVELAPISLQGPGLREALPHGCVHTIPALIRDDLVSKAELGKAYEVIGSVCTSNGGDEVLEITLEVNNILPLEKTLSCGLHSLSEDLHNMYLCLHQMPWSFPLHLAYRFGDEIVSGGTMIKLRLVLLISLVLNPQKHLLHILSLGPETRLSGALMTYSVQFAPRSFPATVTSPLAGKVTTDRPWAWVPYFIQGGPLHLSSGGVCYLHDIGATKKQSREHLQAILAGGRSFPETSTRIQSGPLQQTNCFPLTCHVWAHFDPLGSASTKPASSATQKEAILPVACTGDLSKSYLDSFSFLCFHDDSAGMSQEEISCQMMCHILESSMGEEAQSPPAGGLDREDVDKFVSLARACEPEMTVEAETLLQSYYLSSRLARSSALGGSDVPPSASSALTSLAVGFAKLKLSPLVVESDAVMAIYLFEESLSARLGLSVLSVRHQPHIPNSQIARFLGKEHEQEMKEFQSHLESFCSRVSESRQVKREE